MPGGAVMRGRCPGGSDSPGGGKCPDAPRLAPSVLPRRSLPAQGRVPRLHIIIYGRVAAEAECRSLVSDAGDDACGAQRDVRNSITTREMRAALVRGLVAAVLLVLPSASRASERRCT